MMHVLIRKVAEPYGWLGNMSPYPVEVDGKVFRTTEALFQAMRFDDEAIIEEIRAQKSPMAAKMVTKKHRSKMVVEPRTDRDLENMRFCLRQKLEQHPELKQQLRETSSQEIIEDCTKRQQTKNLYWGAANVNNEWVGTNWLGKLWMELRDELAVVSVERHVDVD